MPRSPNQRARSSSWTPGCEKSNRTSVSIHRPTSASATRSPNEPAQYRDHGRSQTTSAPPNGRRISAVVTSLHRDEDDDENDEPARDRECIGAEQARLGLRHAARDVACPAREAGDRAADGEGLHHAHEEAGHTHRPPVEDEVVRLVEPELVLQRALHEGEPRYGQAAARVHEPRRNEAGQPEREGERARDRLLP